MEATGVYWKPVWHVLEGQGLRGSSPCTILTAAFHILRDSASYQDLGPDHFVQRDRARVAQRLARRLRELGYEVTISQAA